MQMMAAQNSLTVRQQMKSLLASIQLKEELLRQEKCDNSLDDSKNSKAGEAGGFIIQADGYSSHHEQTENTESNDIMPSREDCALLVSDEVPAEASCPARPDDENTLKRKPFLKKGEGTARFRMKPRKLKRRSKYSCSKDDPKFPVVNDVQTKSVHEARSAPLIAFEQLEQKLDDSSFCSTSSMIVKLMEDSIKSTPIKCMKVVGRQDANLVESNSSGSNRGTMRVIDEEDSVETLRLLLETRSLELEVAIQTFKTESAQLSRLRLNYQKEYNQFCQERIMLLENIRTEHLNNFNLLEEEKESLQCEKRAFEKYRREEKDLTKNEEIEEIRLLKQEINTMKEEINRKENRWTAAQARSRTEMRLLKDQNTILQREVNDLKKTKNKVVLAPVLKKSKSASSMNDAPQTTTKRTTLPLSYQFGDGQLTSNSSVFTGNSLASYENDHSSVPNANNSFEENDASNEITTFESFSVNASEFTKSHGNSERGHADGGKEIWCANGSVRKISSDGKTTKTIFYNGDVEEVNVEENVVKYYHAASNTWHSKFANGSEMTEFPDGQVEKYYEDGSAKIVSPDGTIYTCTPRGEKQWIQKDGSVVTIDEEKQEKRIMFPNGQIEIHVPEFKRREYPDGTVKTIYNNSGMQETRYPNGRIRLKTRDGTLISDTEIR